jgi:tetratricopeptide (TPR) repeat protein
VPDPPSPNLDRTDESAQRLVRSARQKVEASPRSGAEWGQYGLVLRGYGFSTEARAAFAQAERLDPKNPRWPYFQAMLFTVDQPQKALEKLHQAVELCGNEPEMPRFRLASLMVEAGDKKTAVSELETLLAAKPDYAPARLLLARCELARGNVEGAIVQARKCTDDPRTAKASWTLLANLYRRQGREDLASQALASAALKPADAEANDSFEAEADMLRRDPRMLSGRGHTLLAAGRLVEAEPIIEELIQKYPAYPDTWLLLGRLQFLRGQFAAAEHSLRNHMQLDSRSTQGLFQLGMALLNQNRHLEAAQVFAEATRLKPDFGPAHHNRGVALGRAGRFDEAILAFQECVRHNPENVETYFLCADLCLRTGRKKEAVALLESVRKLKPDDPRLADMQARASQ